MNEQNGIVSRTVHCDDAIKWIGIQEALTNSSIVASLPDISEFPSATLEVWKKWFVDTAEILLAKTPVDGVTIFYQSDIKLNGIWVDKSYLCQKAAESTGKNLLWHKVVSRVIPGNVTFGRPGYSHILCFSKNVVPDIKKATADILPTIGDKVWERGMGIEACILIASFIKEQTTSTTMINPFCGHGSMLAVAEQFGLVAVGIERSQKRALIAKKIQVDLKSKKWLRADRSGEIADASSDT